MTARGFTGRSLPAPGARWAARDWAFLAAIGVACAATRLL
jgi:hypothetical protein